MIDERDELDDLMRDLMQEGALEPAPANFTQMVMGQIAAETSKPKLRWKPIISMRGWIAIGLGIATSIAAALILQGPSKGSLPIPEQILNTMSQASSFFGSISVPMILAMSATAIAALAGLDRFLSTRRNSSFNH